MDVESTGLEAESSFIVGVGFMYEDGSWRHVFASSISEEARVVAEAVEEASRFDTVVTWNGAGFDVPMLIARALANGVDPSPLLKPRHVDLFRVFREHVRLGRYGLDDVAKFLKIPKRVELKGSDMPPLYLRALSGDSEALRAIEEHCRDDLEALRAIFNRSRGLVEAYVELVEKAGARQWAAK
ncbi:MAG: ribonuclease H-like domain-containing protein [Candidatus Nezhaarchaeota archaeon]|nr:ribonuclease H-like domain-containing protein [Candidatus Nezhaarchaeota archaeon]